MAVTEDIILRILSESTQIRSDLVGLKAQFDSAIQALVSATKQPTFDLQSQQALNLRKNVELTGRAFFTAFNSARTQSKELNQVLNTVESELKKVKDGADRVGSTGKGISELSRAFGQLRTGLASLGVALGAREVLQLGVDAVNTTVRMEAMRAQINAAAGSVEAGADLFRFASDQANRLGQSYFTVGEATARFEAATRRSNLSLEERRFVMQSVLETARVLQLSDQRLSNTLLALEQIASKGTFSLEELRRQLGDNIPGAVQILAAQLNVSVAELFKMIEANEVLSESMVDLARGMNETFGPGLQGALETTSTKIGQVRNRIIDIKVAFGEAFSDELNQAIAKFSEESSNLEAGATSAGKGAAFLTRALLAIAESGAQAGEGMAHVHLGGLRNSETFRLLTEDTDKVRESIIEFSESLPDLVSKTGDVSSAVNSLFDALTHLQLSGETDPEVLRVLLDAAIKISKSLDDANPRLEAFINNVAELSGSTVEPTEKLTRFTEILSDLAKSSPSASGALQVIVSQLNNFIAAGASSGTRANELISSIDSFVESVEKVGDRVPPILLFIRDNLLLIADAAKTGAEQVSTALEDIATSQAQFSGELKRSAEEAANEVLNLVKVIESSTADIEKWDESIQAFVRSGGSIARANSTQLDELKNKIQETIDAYLLMGEEVPPLIQNIANELGVLSSVAEKELKKQVEAAEKAAKEEKKAIEERIKNYQKLLESIRDITRELQPESRADDISGEISDLQSQLNALESKPIFDPGDREKIDELKDKIFELRGELEDLQQGFDSTSASVEDVDEAISELLEGNAEAFAQLTQSQRASIANLLSGLQSLASNGQATGGAVVDIFRQVAGVLDEAGVNTESLYEAFGQLDGQGLNVANMLDRLVRSVEESETGQEGLANQAKRTTEELEEQRKKIGELVVEIENLSTRGVEAMRPFLDIMSETLSVCERLRDCINDMGS